MPGPWMNLPENQEYFKEVELIENAYYKLKHHYDDDGAPQRTGFWQVTHMMRRKRKECGCKDV